MAVGILAEPQHGERALLQLAEARGLRVAVPAKPRRDRVERIREVAPPRRRVGSAGGEPAARALPTRQRRLRFRDFVRAHAIEEIVPRIMLADMVEAQEAPCARTIEIGRLQGRLELAGRTAARDGALRLRPFDPSV